MIQPAIMYDEKNSYCNLRQNYQMLKVQPSEILEQILTHIKNDKGAQSAFVEVDDDGARSVALAADHAFQKNDSKPLSGLVVSIKDLFAIEGKTISCGVNQSPWVRCEKDADVVKRLKDAGAIIIGRTHLHGFAFGLTGENPDLGTPINPIDEDAIPGGSSSGSAVSVASGAAMVSIGTDTGGSVRIPAAFCNIVGFKPGHSKISAEGAFAVAPSIDHVGMFARCVEDCELVYRVLADYQEAIADIETPRFGILETILARADQSVRDALKTKLSNYQTKMIEFSYLKEAQQIYGTLVLAEIATVHDELIDTMPDNYDDLGKGMVEKGRQINAVDYLAADKARYQLANKIEALIDKSEVDVLALPTAPIAAPDLGASRVEVNGRSRSVAGLLVENTSPFSLTGLPAISIPMGMKKGRPMGLQLVAKRGEELKLLAIAKLLA